MRMKSVCCGVVALLALGSLVSAGTMGTVSQSDDDRSACVTWSLEGSGSDIWLKLVIENKTTKPADVTDTLTGFSFALEGGSISSLRTNSLSGDLIDIFTDGTWDWADADGDGNNDTVPNNWGIGDGDNYDAVDDAVANIVHFTAGGQKTAKHAIVGPASSSGVYANLDPFADANRSIAGNPGHNPFVKQVLTMGLNLSNVDEGAFNLTDGIIYFGTGLEVTIVPLPSGAWMGLALLGGVGMVQIVRRRRRLNAI